MNSETLRCHRIGQEKEVFVKRLVVEDTIEERYVFYAEHNLPSLKAATVCSNYKMSRWVSLMFACPTIFDNLTPL